MFKLGLDLNSTADCDVSTSSSRDGISSSIRLGAGLPICDANPLNPVTESLRSGDIRRIAAILPVVLEAPAASGRLLGS